MWRVGVAGKQLYLIVTIFCEFLRFGKIAKLSTRKNFYQHLRHSRVCTITNCVAAWCFPLNLEHAKSFSFDHLCLSFLPSRAVTSSRKWRLMISMIVGVSREQNYRVRAAPCGMFHINLRIHENYMYLLCCLCIMINFNLESACDCHIY